MLGGLSWFYPLRPVAAALPQRCYYSDPNRDHQQKGSKTKAVRYDKIISVTHGNRVFKSLVLQTAGDKLVINKSILNYQLLWELLKARLPETARKPADGNLLHVRCSYSTCFSYAVFVTISAALIVLGWYAFFTGQAGIGGALLITLVLLPFTAALFIAMLRTPRYYLFYPEAIVVKSLTGKKAYPVSKITRFSCGQRFVKVNARIGSYCAHFVELTFDGSKKPLIIDSKDTNYPIERLIDFLTATYRLERIKTVVAPER